MVRDRGVPVKLSGLLRGVLLVLLPLALMSGCDSTVRRKFRDNDVVRMIVVVCVTWLCLRTRHASFTTLAAMVRKRVRHQRSSGVQYSELQNIQKIRKMGSQDDIRRSSRAEEALVTTHKRGRGFNILSKGKRVCCVLKGGLLRRYTEVVVKSSFSHMNSVNALFVPNPYTLPLKLTILCRFSQ